MVTWPVPVTWPSLKDFQFACLMVGRPGSGRAAGAMRASRISMLDGMRLIEAITESLRVGKKELELVVVVKQHRPSVAGFRGEVAGLLVEYLGDDQAVGWD